MIRGAGVDVVDIARFRGAIERRGQRLLARLFTPGELEYCLEKRRPEAHLAARFAAKESLYKATGARLRFSEIEVVRDSSGRPGFRLLREGSCDGLRLHLSMSHDGSVAIGTTIAEYAP